VIKKLTPLDGALLGRGGSGGTSGSSSQREECSQVGCCCCHGLGCSGMNDSMTPRLLLLT